MITLFTLPALFVAFCAVCYAFWILFVIPLGDLLATLIYGRDAVARYKRKKKKHEYYQRLQRQEGGTSPGQDAKPNKKIARQQGEQEVKLLGDLRRLLYGDESKVDRLLNVYRSQHPGKSRVWLIEKAIWDIERDRR